MRTERGGRRLFAPIASLAAAWLSVGACAPLKPAPPAIRLLDDSRRAGIEWPQAAGEPPAELERDPSVRRPARDRVARVAMARADLDAESRLALLAPPGSRWRFELELPEEARLRTGLGYATRLTPEGLALRFRVALEATSGGRELLLDERVATAAADGWRDREVDLGRWAGESVALIFETEVEAGAGALPWAAWSAPEVFSAAGREEGWDVILVSLDTLRADHLGAWGYERQTSPELDAFAARGVRFASAISPAPWTRPAHLSLFTGLYPLSKGGLAAPPIAMELRRAGYRTVAMTGGGQVDYRMGFGRGFDEYRLSDWIRDLDRVLEWVDETASRRRFLFLHTYEIHDPYIHPELAAGLPAGRVSDRFDRWEWEHLRETLSEDERRYIEALYDGGIAYTDRQLGALFRALEGRGALDRAVVIVTADHGEQFFEHGNWRHGQNLYDHQLRVPLIVRLPSALAEELGVEPGRVIEDQVQLTDLYPTLLDLLALPLRRPVHGRSLVPLLRGEDLPAREAFAENVNVRTVERKALRTRRYKYVHTFPRPGAPGEAGEEVAEAVELYDLRRDPGEQVNLAAELAEQAAGFERLLQAIMAADGLGEAPGEALERMDPELRRRLEALGYVGQ